MGEHHDSVTHNYYLDGFLPDHPMDLLRYRCREARTSSNVTTFSPLEATIAKPRSIPLTSESLKVRLTELFTGATYVMIPALLLTSTNTVTTSLLVMPVFHQNYMFHKEILLDYDVNRRWDLIYFKILLLIMAKDTIVCLDLYPLR